MMYGVRTRTVAVSFLGLIILALAVAARAEAPKLEYQIKASYLYNFMQFIAWPKDAFGADGKFNLCVVGAERFGTALDALASERVEGREIVVRRLEHAARARAAQCHLLFVAAGSDPTFTEIIDTRGMLTIGEAPGFLEHGGVINLVEVRGRIRFEINQPAARQAGLVVSSRILTLAVTRP